MINLLCNIQSNNEFILHESPLVGIKETANKSPGRVAPANALFTFKSKKTAWLPEACSIKAPHLQIACGELQKTNPKTLLQDFRICFC